MRSALIFLCILLSSALFAQESYTTTDKKAIKYYEVALNDFNRNDYASVISNVDRSIQQVPDFIEAFLLKFEAQMNMRDSEGAEQSLMNALIIDPDFFPNAHYYFGELKMSKGDYTTAQVAFDKFLTYRQTNPNLQDAASAQLRNCEFAIEAMANPVPFDPQNLGTGVNSPMNEYFPTLTTDDRTLIFTRRLPANERTENQNPFQEDFYVSMMENGRWMTARGIGEINTSGNEGAPTISPDGQLLIFTACADNVGNYGADRRGLGSCDLFFSFREGDRWGKPRNIGQAINSKNWETQPSFSSDGRTLYFIRGFRKDGGIKNQDIYMSTLDETGAWTKAVKLSARINSPKDESSVLIHPDGNTLYFTSDGHPGMGGEDIYLSRRGEDGEWETPINLGYPINTFEHENSITVTAGGKMALFASDREGGMGGLDLYQFELPVDMRPARVNFLEGQVVDKKTKRPLESRFELIDLATGEVIVESYSNAIDGRFLVSLPEGKDYALNVKRKGYLFHSENFAMKGGTRAEPYRKQIALAPIEAGERVVLRNVFFDTDSYVLRPESRSELDELIDFLTKNYRMKIELGGHTDDVGSASANKTLSENRANEVKDYLMDHGVPADRLTTKGYGADNPIADNTSEEGRAQNRRTEFKVVSVE